MIPVIRKAAAEDIPKMSALLSELFSIEKDFQIDPRKQIEGLSHFIDQPSRTALVAETETNSIIGMCTAQLIISTAEGGKAALIEDVIVTSNYRGKGIGNSLLKAIEEWSWKQGARRLELLADITNEAAADFYSKLGWHKTRMLCWQKHPLNRTEA